MNYVSRHLSPRFWSFAALPILLMVSLLFACAPGESADATPETAAAQSSDNDAAEADAPESAQDDSLHNTLRWQTASEVDNFGFDVFRADTEEGPFTKVNDDPIVGAGTVDEPQSYVYVDRTNDPTRDYYYYIESISMSNMREHFTPVLKASAKQPVESSEG